MKRKKTAGRLNRTHLSKGMILACALTILLAAFAPSASAYALSVTPIQEVQMYTTSGTPVYAVPDVYSPVVMYLERFVNVRVNGITDNGFFRVDIGGAYYIPGPYMVAKIAPEKTEKQKVLESLDDFAEAYVMLLEQMESYSGTFALIDVTGDGIPEIFDESGKEIYTYYEKRPVMIYYSQYPLTFYYSKKDNKLLGNYTWNGKSIWEVYVNDKSLLPWGQLRCVSTDASLYQKNAVAISRGYANNAETRGDLKRILKEMLEIKD